MRRIRLLGSVVFAGACGGAGGGGGAAVTRDSAGIAIVENTGAAWASAQEWKVIDSVMVDIAGDVDSVTGPVRLADGRLAIANAGTHEVRIYDAAGTQIHASGRVGSGPGEYQMLAGIWRGPGDSLLVSDFLARRVSVLDRDANFARSFSLGGNAGAMVPTWEIEVRQMDGKLARLIRVDAKATQLTPADTATHRKAQLDQIGAMPAIWKDADDVERVRAYPLRKGS